MSDEGVHPYSAAWREKCLCQLIRCVAYVLSYSQVVILRFSNVTQWRSDAKALKDVHLGWAAQERRVTVSPEQR